MNWMTAVEAGEHLKLKPRTVVELARLGKLRGYIVSGASRHTWRFIESELDDAMMQSPAVPKERRIQ